MKADRVRTVVIVRGREYEDVDLSIQLKRPVFLVTKGQGTWEISRIYVENGRAKVDARDTGRIGPETVRSLVWDTAHGLTIVTDGYLIHAPAGDVAGSVSLGSLST